MARVPGGGVGSGKRSGKKAAPANPWPKSRPRYGTTRDRGEYYIGGKFVKGESLADKEKQSHYKKNTQTQLNSLRKVKHR